MRSMVVLAVVVVGGCTPTAVTPPPPGGPTETRLTTSADPVAPLQNVTQWNWGHLLVVDDQGGVHATWTQLGTSSIEYAADRPDPVDVPSLPPGQVFYRRSLDGGGAWLDEAALSPRETGLDSPGLAVDGVDLQLVYRSVDGGRWRVFGRRSSDRGATWSAPVGISDNPVGVGVSPPSVAAAGGKVFVVWADGRPQVVGGVPTTVKEVYLAVSVDGGVSFGAAQPVSTPDDRSSWTPSVAATATALHVAWTDERDDLGECTRGGSCREEEYYRRSLDGGATWGPQVRLTMNPAGAPRESWAPSLAATGATVHLAYFDKRGDRFQVYHRRSLDGGASWAEDTLISAGQEAQIAVRPTVAARAGDAAIAWFTFDGGFPADVQLSRSSDGGATWSTPSALTHDAPSAAARIPHVALAPDRRAHTIWYDTRNSDGNGARVEVYHARVEP